MQLDGARKRAATWSSNRSWLRATRPTRRRPVFRERIQRAEPADARCGRSILGMRRGVSGALAAPGHTSASARDATESPVLSLLAALSLRPSCSCPALHSLQQRVALPSPINALPPPCLPSSIGHKRLPPCHFPGMSTHLSPSTLHAHGAGDTLTCVHILLSVLSYPRQWTFSDHVSERSRRWQRLAFAGGDNEEEATSMMTYGSCGGGVCVGNEATTTDPT
ncbi:uncharacterized protein LOC119275527 isoform X1 [Triticum dicoccoides]|uniref:uncharacterized protein LOC119275527 isoform X1 n=1 Tax=Triticum dicoccoides TaxID=85692 RepID=UPI00188E15D3|nr:uncharacterized protein LOC119275527 isoform X1 [Triticum dicoccoides]